MAREQLKNLTEPMYYLLLSLIGEQHGYGIMQSVTQLTDGRVMIGAGTLYALLGRFETEGMIKQVREQDRKKVYTLTTKGRGFLSDEFLRLNQLVSDGLQFLNEDGSLKPPKDGGDGINEEVIEKVQTSKAVAEKETGRIKGKGVFNYG